MGKIEIRALNADEIEVRAQSVKQTANGAGAILLLYKDARCDMRILDEVFGLTGWKRRHEFKNDQNYCTVSIWDEDKKEWIDKEDMGTESNTEREKGQASDAFKRACFNIGIGRELYTAPFIWINLSQDEVNKSGDKCFLKPGIKFEVKSITYDDKRNISGLIIVDGKNVERFNMEKKVDAAKSVPPSQPIEKKKSMFLDSYFQDQNKMIELFDWLDKRKAEQGEGFHAYNLLERCFNTTSEQRLRIIKSYDEHKSRNSAA